MRDAISHSRQIEDDSLRVVRDEALLKKQYGDELIERLEALGEAHNSNAIQFIATKMRSCLAIENLWLGRDLHNAEYELFNAAGTYATCRSQLCPFCGPKHHQPLVRQAITSLEAISLCRGEHWFILTLTSPQAPNKVFLEQLYACQRAWSLLRKRKWWKQNVLGGLKGIEWKKSLDDYHVHIHLLVCCKSGIQKEDLSINWSDAISKAWRAAGYSLEINTRTGLANVDVRRVKKMSTHGKDAQSKITLTNQLISTTRYIFKGSDWNSLNDDDLVAVIELKQFPRLHERFGIISKSDASILEYNQSSDAAINPSLNPRKHKKNLRAQPVRAFIDNVPREEWQGLWLQRSAKAQEYRKKSLAERYPWATFERLTSR